MSELEQTPDLPATPGRKRVVAREVEAENVESAELVPAIIEPIALPAPIIDAPAVVDPTLLGGRRRRSGHQRVYRATQVCSILAILSALVAIVMTLGDEAGLGGALAGGGVVLGIAAIVLSGQNPLSQRWRGWAIASAVFCGAVLGLNILHRALVQ